MRFICDVCPVTASEGKTVIIGNYEEWIRHLLSPEHQTEQNLVMARRTYWPQAMWTAIVKNLPQFEKSTLELFVDVMLQLSEYGFIEAMCYGKKLNDNAFIALQLYETRTAPAFLSFVDGKRFELTLMRKPGNDPRHGFDMCSRKGTQQRRRQSSSSSSCDLPFSPKKNEMRVPSHQPMKNGLVETAKGICDSVKSQGAVTVTDGFDESVFQLNALSITSEGSVSSSQNVENSLPETTSVGVGTCTKIRGKRIKYDKETLLLYCGEKAMPLRFKEILAFPKELIEEEPKLINPDQLKVNIQWQSTNTAGGSHFKPQQRNGAGSNNRWTTSNLVDTHSRWQKIF